jgi:ribosomal protein S6
LRAYDFVVIYRPATEEAMLEEEIGKISEVVNEAGGETIEINRWGKKPLGYEIRGERSGVYVVFKFRTEAPVLAKLKKQLDLNESVLRQRVLIAKEVPEVAVEEAAEVVEEQAAPEEQPGLEVE